MSSSSKWRGNEAMTALKMEMRDRMGAAVGFLRGETIKAINVSQPTRKQASGRRVGLDPSKEGEPPKRVEGDLVRSIVDNVKVKGSKITGSYGSTQTRKALRLEFGFSGTDSLGRTVDQGPRPFLRPPLLENKDKLRKILIE